jgi:ketol-acid reductoisomerase
MAKLNFGGVEETVVTREEFTLDHAREVLKDETIAVIGYGVQGPGQSLNLKDNGFNVIVGQRQGKTFEKAIADGWVPGETLFGIEEACEKASIIMCLLSDAAVMSVWPNIKKHLTAGKALYFSHGFAITWSDRTGCVPPKDIDVIMVAPKGSGTSLRSMFLEGRGLNSSYAIYQDVTGRAYERTIALGIGIGSGYLFETTFQREATSDLTGERGSLMGAIQGLLLAQYEVLRENGHSPSEAFNETVEELTQSLMPLFAQKGMDWMYANCSTTAQRGALDWYPRFHDAIKPVMQQLYNSVKCGNEAQISIDSNSKPDYRVGLEAELKALRDSEMWQTAVTVRKLRPENEDK